MSKLKHAEKTFLLRGLLFQVRNELKLGWPEEAYHQAFVEVLRQNDVPVLSKQRLDLLHRGILVHTFEADVIVWELIILELKALAFETTFSGVHLAQLIHYLKCYGKDLGLLVNFSSTPIAIKRVVWDEPRLDIAETYSDIQPLLVETDKPLLRQVRECILTIARQYGLGYPETVYRNLITIELEHCGISCISDVQAPAHWGNTIQGYHEIPHLLVAEKYLIHIRSLLAYPTSYDFTRTKTYLKSLKVPIGLVINFGRTQLQIYGVTTT